MAQPANNKQALHGMENGPVQECRPVLFADFFANPSMKKMEQSLSCSIFTKGSPVALSEGVATLLRNISNNF
jgi:hypothetical protein